MPPLLERDSALNAVTAALDAARTIGQLVGVSGEAGIGKSALLQACAERTSASRRWLWGYCEALGTPRPLGPLLDIAPQLGGQTAARLAAGAARHEVFAAFLADLIQADGPTAVCIEDVHWADEATLDLLHFLARRLHHTRTVIVLTWRDDELRADHGVYRVLSATVPAAVHRIGLQPLSLAAIAELAAGRRDAAEVHALTRGNPFFVTEIVTSTDGSVVPASVRDAVLARRARLDADARALLDLVAAVPARVELGVLERAAGSDFGGLEPCMTAGLLTGDTGTVAFRHELARLAVADALPVPRARACHQRMLDALVAGPRRELVLARIVHHAEAAGATAALLEHAPAAARQAARLGAHRQAVEHYQRALRHASTEADEVRAPLIEGLAYELYLTGDIPAARAARFDALAVGRRLGDVTAMGRNTRWLSRLSWFLGEGDVATRYADEAIHVLRGVPEQDELAMAYSNRAQVAMLSSDAKTCLLWGNQAIALARQLDAPEVLSHALNNVGAIEALSGNAGGWTLLEESLRIALDHDFHEHAARAFTNLASSALDVRDYARAQRWLEDGLNYCAERDLESWTVYMRASRARLRADTGLWQGAVEDAETVLAGAGAMAVSRIIALTVIGQVRLRRGDPGASRALDDALALAAPTGEAQRLLPIRALRAEHAFFTGRADQVVAEVRAALDPPGNAAHAADRERLRHWLHRVEPPGAADVSGDGPFARMVQGGWQSAADTWNRMGCPYERALALADGDADAVEQAIELFHGLGAAPAADWARQRLRDLGATRVPRGRRASTLAHPAGLTTREGEVLALMALGLKNPQIADRLFVSAKTVEHHVSAILGKLLVDTRDEAVSRARERGWLPDRG